MSIHDRLAALAGHLHLSGFGSEVNTAWTKVSTLFADEIASLKQGGGGPGVEDRLAAAERGIAELVAFRDDLLVKVAQVQREDALAGVRQPPTA